MRQPSLNNTILFLSRRLLVLLFFITCTTLAGAQLYDDTTVVTVEPAEDTTYEEEDYGTYDEKGDFQEKNPTDSFSINERTLPTGYQDSLKKDSDFWYADADLKKKIEPARSDNDQYIPIGQRSWFQFLLWLIIIGGFSGAIMWYLMESNVGLFRRKDVPVTGSSAHDEIPEDIFAINYQREIDKAVAQGNYRLAVRLMYLRLLKNMADKDIIQYKQDRTNFDYLLQLQPTQYYQHFFRLTRHYEYSWYGHFDVEENAYKIIAGEFNQFDKLTR